MKIRAYNLFIMLLIVFIFTACGKKIPAESIDPSTPAEEQQATENKNVNAESIYMDALGNYLKEQLDLASYDKQIAEFGCIPVDIEEQSEHQKEKNMGLKYIYLRNEPHLDRLSDEDMALLTEAANGSSINRQLITEMVVRTFEQVLSPREITSEEDRKVQTIYDDYLFDYNSPRMVDMNSVVLHIATQSDYDEQGNIIDEEKEDEKENALHALSERMEDEMDGLLGDNPVRVFIDFIN
jgi:predicted small lipoprotein YifL